MGIGVVDVKQLRIFLLLPRADDPGVPMSATINRELLTVSDPAKIGVVDVKKLKTLYDFRPSARVGAVDVEKQDFLRCSPRATAWL